MRIPRKSIITSALVILALSIIVQMNALQVIVSASEGVYINGRVTVFSNMVIKSPTTSVSKTVVHPADVASSVLHVKGQSNGDSSQRTLTVTVNGQTRICQYVSGSFDIADTETGIVSAGQLNTVAITLDTTYGSWNIQCFYQVSTLGTDVYIIIIPGVQKSWVTDMDAVARGVASSCMVTPLVHTDAWQPLTYLEITDMTTYKQIIENPNVAKPSGFRGETGVVVVNAHGEVLPLPSSYTWSTWIDVISSSIQTRGLTWAQVAGWPFYYWSYDTGQSDTIGAAGFKKFMEPIAGQPNNINCNSARYGTEAQLSQEYGSRLSGYGLVAKGLTQGRPIEIGVSYPAYRDEWTESLTCSDGYWDHETLIDIETDTSRKTTGSASIKGTPFGSGPLGGIMSFTWNSGKEPNANNYPVLCFDVYLLHAINGAAGFTVILWDSQNRLARSVNYGDENLADQEWCSVAIRREEWGLVDAGFDWSSIKKMWLCCSATYAWYWFDNIYFDTGASTICHSFDVMNQIENSVNYLTLGLIGFGRPNQGISNGQQIGYYVHNGAGAADSDYNKGKYSMAAAAWTKISLLASTQVEVVMDNCQGTPPSVGNVRCKLLWSKAILSGDQWVISFVTETVSCVKYDEQVNNFDLADGLAPLKVFDPAYPPPSTQSPCTFDFITSQSRAVSEKSHTSWEGVVTEGVWIAVNVVLAWATAGASAPASVLLALAMGGLQAYSNLAIAANEQPNPVYGPDYVDLSMNDNSELDIYDSSGVRYRQFQSYGLVQVGLPKIASGGADHSISFKFGQRAKYVAFAASMWYSGQDTITRRMIVEPRLQGDSNADPLPVHPSGETQPYANMPYEYIARTTDQDKEDVRYKFLWSDGSPTITGWYESGNTVTVSHTWTNFGLQSVSVYVQDSQRAYNPNDWITSSPVAVQVLTKLTIATSVGGTTDPSPGIHGYVLNTQLNVYPNPSPGYVFSHWKLDGTVRYENPLPVTMNSDHSLEAYFADVRKPLITIMAPSPNDPTMRHTGNSNGNDCNMQIDINSKGPNCVVGQGQSVPLRFWGNIWARPGAPGNWMVPVLGLEGTPLDAAGGMIPGVFPGKNYSKTFTFTASYPEGVYRLYGVAASVSSSQQAFDFYRDYPTARFLVGILVVGQTQPVSIHPAGYGLTVSAEVYPPSGLQLTQQTVNGETGYVFVRLRNEGGSPLFGGWHKMTWTSGGGNSEDNGGPFTYNYNISTLPTNAFYFLDVYTKSTNLQEQTNNLIVYYYNRAPYACTLSGATPAYVYTSYPVPAYTTDQDLDMILYEYDWNDAAKWSSGWVAQGTTVYPSHQWTRPGTYCISVKAKDAYSAWSSLSWRNVTITQNDDGYGGDASNTFADATVYNYLYSKGTLYASNPTDEHDWYQFYAETGQTISAWLSSTGGANFDLELFYPNQTLRARSSYTSSYDAITITATSSGMWRMHIYRTSGEGLYYFGVSVYTPGPPGGCPILYTYSNEDYQCEGLLNIHNEAGIDVTAERTLTYFPQAIRGSLCFKLVEHPQTISEIDQVQLFAVLRNGEKIRLHLTSAWHSEYGNVLPQLLRDDEWKAVELGANHNNGASQSILLRFEAPPPNVDVIGFVIQIEGNNMIVKV